MPATWQRLRASVAIRYYEEVAVGPTARRLVLGKLLWEWTDERESCWHRHRVVDRMQTERKCAENYNK